MPIFQTETKKYRCRDCGEIYFLRVPSWENDKKCPKCAIDEYAKEKGYAFVFDVAGAMTIIYADPKWDINDQIMQKLGVTASSSDED